MMGGTGGGIFRKMYGEFLVEASYILQDNQLKNVGEKFIHVAGLWDIVADDLWRLAKERDVNQLQKISDSILTIAKMEELLYNQLMTIICQHVTDMKTELQLVE